MKCKLIGYGHIFGEKSRKTGQPYDFYSLSVTYKDKSANYVGERSREIAVNPDQVNDIEKIVLPAIIDVARDFDGRTTVQF